MFDRVICGGEAIDWTKARRFAADVAVQGDRIAQAGDLSAAEVVDGTPRTGFSGSLPGGALKVNRA
ncbi:MAG: hypothetical protein IT329_21070 [Caldilineaceae bacterium]|nr:hypothetical protein [Caldilineaceae bacterium]